MFGKNFKLIFEDSMEYIIPKFKEKKLLKDMKEVFETLPDITNFNNIKGHIIEGLKSKQALVKTELL